MTSRWRGRMTSLEACRQSREKIWTQQIQIPSRPRLSSSQDQAPRLRLLHLKSKEELKFQELKVSRPKHRLPKKRRKRRTTSSRLREKPDSRETLFREYNLTISPKKTSPSTSLIHTEISQSRVREEFQEVVGHPTNNNKGNIKVETRRAKINSSPGIPIKISHSHRPWREIKISDCYLVYSVIENQNIILVHCDTNI